MHEVLHLKFQQHPDLLKELLETGKKRLVFVSRREPYWGWEENGQNHLGKILEVVRDDFMKSAVDAAVNSPSPARLREAH
jgi:predicted NAD-dependent protein-ADP-ribosyltransferase YbiA (DUF1768 family)